MPRLDREDVRVPHDRHCAAPVALIIAVGGFAFVAARPEWAAYVYLATLPFVGGIDRGSIIPLPSGCLDDP